MQTYIETEDRKLNEILVRFNMLPDIFNRYDTARSELELLEVVDHSGGRELFENQYYEAEAKFNELLHPVVNQPVHAQLITKQFVRT
jgi:hypothetical protein